MSLGKSVTEAKRALVTTALLRKGVAAGYAFENPDGSPLKIDTDYFGKRRDEANPSAGPFEKPMVGPATYKVWPLSGLSPGKSTTRDASPSQF